jgi:hypothetical protein
MPLQRGDVYRYHYLWAREHENQEESGRKARPVCLILRSPETGRLFLFALTTKQPAGDRLALEVPAAERRLGGLTTRCWLIMDEYNRAPESALHDFESLQPLGRFSDTFLTVVARRLDDLRRAGRIKAAPRT